MNANPAPREVADDGRAGSAASRPAANRAIVMINVEWPAVRAAQSKQYVENKHCKKFQLMESDMSRLKTSCSLIAAFSILAVGFSAEAAVQIKHRHAPGFVGPVFQPSPPINNSDFGATFGGGGGGGFSRDSGGVNSMSNDFGTSGVLGHKNGQPILGH